MVPNQLKPEVTWDIPKRIIVIENAISPELCDSIIEFGNNTVTKGVNKYPNVFGISFHACLLPLNHEVHEALQSAWKQAIDYYDFDISFIEPYEIKRYTRADFFGKHTDNYYSLTENLDRKITMSVQLNDTVDYKGGDLSVIGNVSSARTKGSLTVFPSNFPHEVKPILSGVRWSLIGWAWGPYWK